MPVTILLPTALQRYADGRDKVTVRADSVGGALKALSESQPDLAGQLFNKEGQIRSFVNVYLGDEDTRYLQGSDTLVSDGDTLTIVPSIAGG
jgi:adenylyltransferase/sulfurtransferase